MAETKLQGEALNKFNVVTKMVYKNQAIFFLNAFWKEFESKATDKFAKGADAVFNFYQQFIEIDKRQWEEVNKKVWKQGWKESSALDEFFSHKFLEVLDKTMTAITFRNEFRKIDVNFDKRMALVEFLLFEYKQEVSTLMNRPQDENKEEIEKAQAKMAEVQKALEEVQAQLDEQKRAVAAQKEAERAAKEALDAQTAAENEAKSALAAQKQAEKAAHAAVEVNKKLQADAEAALVAQQAAEDQVRAAEAELRTAVEDLERQDAEHKGKLASLEKTSHDQSIGIVQRNKASNEFAQLKEKDPLPLRKAKITQEAALHRVEAERKTAEKATAKASEVKAKAEAARIAAEETARLAGIAREAAEEKAKQAEEARLAAEEEARKAEEARAAAEEQARVVEKAVQETQEKMAAAEAYLEEVKKKAGNQQGAIWWVGRELKEAKKFMPGYKKE